MSGPGDPNFEARCQDIRDTAQHMADLVTDLLDIGKIEAGLDAAREPMDLVPVADEALRLVRPNAERKTIELTADLPETAIVTAAPIRVRQALVNLIDNGIKYTPSGGRVTVTAAFSAGGDRAESVTIRVGDSGIGIPARGSSPRVRHVLPGQRARRRPGLREPASGSRSPGPSSIPSAAASASKCRGSGHDVHRRAARRTRVTPARHPR